MNRWIVVALVFAVGAQAADEGKSGAALLRPLTKRTDDMAQVTWFQDRDSSKYTFGTRGWLYFGRFAKKGELVGPLRMNIIYEGRAWLFAHSLTLKIDGVLHEVHPEAPAAGGCDWRREIASVEVQTVEESCDFAISMLDAEVARALGTAKSVKIRFNGRKGVHDWIVPRSQLAAMRRVYAAWNAQPK